MSACYFAAVARKLSYDIVIRDQCNQKKWLVGSLLGQMAIRAPSAGNNKREDFFP